ncbi:MAG: 3-octaprenyl-4-hydroxybenzoate carboxy-lyase [bacterium ADurb.Bin243]|nr:MAG: 3-octaprenyl-4-hydroxybenzoate carboxy-lyase [bacterium ADurb.Bin243]
MFNDLNDFINELKSKKEIIEIEERVEPSLEAAEIADRMVKRGGPALLFKNVAGCSLPLAMNLFATKKRMQMALGVSDFSEISGRIENLLKPPAGGGIFNKITEIPRLLEAAKCLPRVISRENSPCKQIIIKDESKIDLGVFPIIKCWPQDGGNFITFPMVITKNPVSGVQNIGMYRMQVISANKTAMHWHKHKDGAFTAAVHKERGELKVPVSVAIGADPASMYAATAPLPYGVDEILFAGFLRNSPVDLVKSELSDILVPARAEIILEGVVDLNEMADEGPFGDHTGYYSPKDKYPTFNIKCITMRKNPMFIGTLVGVPPMEDFFLGQATERIFLPLLKLQCPEIIDIRFPAAGVFHNLALVKIKKMYKGQVQKVASFFWGLNQLMFTKNIVVYDETTDIHNNEEALFTLLANADFKRDVFSFDGPLDILDHASLLEGFGPKTAIDATHKKNEPGTRDWPELVKMSKNIKKIVDEKWSFLFSGIDS